MQLNISGQSGVLGLAAITALIVAGCTQVPLKTLEGAPDGNAEVLEGTDSPDRDLKHVNAQFLDVVKQPGRVVLVEFWATWCGPCLQLAPELEGVVRQFGDTVTVVKVDIESAANAELRSFFEIYAIPEMRIFVNGEPVGSISGYADSATIARKLQPFVEAL